MVNFIIQLRDRNEPHLFLPLLLGSQPCEATFRQLRSMTTTSSTVINFNTLEMIHRLKKIQLQNDIMVSSPDFIKFPRLDAKRQRMDCPAKLPSNKEICDLLEDARKRTITDALYVGINVNEKNSKINFACQISYVTEDSVEDSVDSYEEDDLDDDTEPLDGDDFDENNLKSTENNEAEMELQNDLCKLSSIAGSLNLKDHSSRNVLLNEKSPYTIVVDANGKSFVVRKSSIVWLLTRNKHSLSSDRLSRVKEYELNKTKTGN